MCTGHTPLCSWGRANAGILELGSVPGSHSLDVARFSNEPWDKYLSRTEVYIKYVRRNGPDWFYCKSFSFFFLQLQWIAKLATMK